MEDLGIDGEEFFAIHAWLAGHSSQKDGKIGLLKRPLLILLVKDEDAAEMLVAAIIQLLLKNLELVSLGRHVNQPQLNLDLCSKDAAGAEGIVKGVCDLAACARHAHFHASLHLIIPQQIGTEQEIHLVS